MIRLKFNAISQVVSIGTSLVNGKVFTEWVCPAMLKAYQSQVSNGPNTSFNQIYDDLDNLKTKVLYFILFKNLYIYYFQTYNLSFPDNIEELDLYSLDDGPKGLARNAIDKLPTFQFQRQCHNLILCTICLEVSNYMTHVATLNLTIVHTLLLVHNF